MSIRRSAALHASRPLVAAATLAIAALGMGGAAAAQSASSTASTFKNGYGGTGLSGFEQPVNVTTRDSNGNLLVTDGVIQVGSDLSIFSHLSVGGASDSYSGVGAIGSATAVGNSLNVSVQGNYNTVVVNSNQTNNGAISATTVLNGKVNLDAGQ